MRCHKVRRIVRYHMPINFSLQKKLLIMCCFCSVSLEMKFIAIRFYNISLKQNESAKSSEYCEYTQNKV